MKIIVYIIGICMLIFLFYVNRAMNKPVYNKMSNMWLDDPDGKKIADMTVFGMMLICFILGCIT